MKKTGEDMVPQQTTLKFEAKEEFKSVINTDPKIGERFSLLFNFQNNSQVDQVTDGVYLARGFGQGNAIMVEGTDGVAVFDVGDSYEHGKAMLDAFREYTTKPIKAIIYSHYHFDHIFGSKAFVEDAASDVQIISHESTVRYLNERVSALAPRVDWGLAMQFGLYLDEADEVGTAPLGSGVQGIQFPRIGSIKGHKRHVIYPNRTFRDQLEIEIGGVKMVLIHSPSETPDNILLWLPEKKTLLSGDTLTPVMVPIFTARGQRVRDPEDYLDSIDLIRSLHPEHIVPSHGPAFSGLDADELLLNYRDVVAFIYHQTVRMINQGYGPEQIANRLSLPPHLADNLFLGEWYNDVQSNVRGIYSYLVGHYADVSEMPLLSPETADANMIELAGGPTSYLEKLETAYNRGDYTWVARAATHLIRLDPDNMGARKLKASALRALAAKTTAGAHRHFYLQHAAALEGHIDIPVAAHFTEDDVSTVPVASLIEKLPFRLNGVKALKEKCRFSITISDSKEEYLIELRNGIAEVLSGEPEGLDGVDMSSESFRLFYIGALTLDEGFANGKMKGDKATMQSFFSLFDWPTA